MQASLHAEIESVVCDLQALLYALAEEVPTRAISYRIYRIDATKDLIDGLLGTNRLEELLGVWEIL